MDIILRQKLLNYSILFYFISKYTLQMNDLFWYIHRVLEILFKSVWLFAKFICYRAYQFFTT